MALTKINHKSSSINHVNFKVVYKSHYNKISIITKCKKLLRLCPNLITLSNKCVTFLSLFVDKNELLIPKLSKVRLTLNFEEIELIETLAKNYANSLKSVLFEVCSPFRH